jgi:hypothetical protein
MAKPVVLPPQPGSRLCDIRIFRWPDGSIRAELLDMDPRLIETTGVEVVDRLRQIAAWVADAAQSLLVTAQAMEMPIVAGEVG